MKIPTKNKTVQMQTISIYQDGAWVGQGRLNFTPNNGGYFFLSDCPAMLGDNSSDSETAYEAIDQAINEGRHSVTIGDHTYSWVY